MIAKLSKHRVRANHKPIYAILWLLENQRGKDKPVPSIMLADLIERSVTNCEIHKKNYNRTCRTLVEHGMLSRQRDEISGRVAFNLTDKSREIADQCFIDVFKMHIEQFIEQG
ncbi:hypothetical protein G6Z92_06345 [Vibrio aestuarianus subsp. cardii]|uniref:hypothetical protein n=1 Tax=Vibrio aestuarianus TaxID=28171 RepID=UPI0015C53DE6|nr:hypothetical protein [Vibrio aestuarianus]NGZ66605.1 hypothetical protein [Vibrio aestuarianus subsp. cardii]